MSESTLPVSFRCGDTPSTLYAIDVADKAHGIRTQPLQLVNWSGVNGASLAPKSTVRAVIAAIPPPDPTGL